MQTTVGSLCESSCSSETGQHASCMIHQCLLVSVLQTFEICSKFGKINFVQEILDSFEVCEFWYVDQGIHGPETDGSSSFHRVLQRQEDKWWLPVPRVPPGGLQEDSRKQLQQKRDSTNQILKAAIAINSATLADLEIPEPYLEALPKVRDA